MLVARQVGPGRNQDRCADVSQQIGPLERVLHNFRFRTTIVELNTKPEGPQRQLDKAMLDFVHKNDGPPQTHLLIVYYTGHGQIQVEAPHELILAGRTPEGRAASEGEAEPEANWNKAAHALDEVSADVLVILDCCYAGNIMLESRSGHSLDDPRSYELMTATGANLPAASPGEGSYTKMLIDALGNLRQRRQAFTTAELNQEISQLCKYDTRSQSYNRLPGRARHIRLDPVSPHQHAGERAAVNEGVSLKVRIDFRDRNRLQEGEVEKLALELGKLPKSTGLRISHIEFAGFEPRRVLPLDAHQSGGSSEARVSTARPPDQDAHEGTSLERSGKVGDAEEHTPSFYTPG
ncbi:hypothetical protein LTR53_005578 [Teratosphaeriaceae sp. CCFEE 6253]|nr:hypothetical protein LTR53_005578 [Teratosphaeriaceae sp. CCFEE 6253]